MLYTAEGAHHYLHEAHTLPPTRCSCPQRCTNGCRCLLQKKAGRKEARSSSFNKLLLRFNHLDKGFTKCREVFHSLDVDGNNVIDLEVCLHLKIFLHLIVHTRSCCWVRGSGYMKVPLTKLGRPLAEAAAREPSSLGA